MRPLTYSKLRLVDLNAAQENLDTAPLQPFLFDSPSRYRIVRLMSEPAAMATMEDWFKGNDVEWMYHVDVIFVVLSGSAEVIYWDAPQWTTRRTVVAAAGMMYLLPRGCRAHHRVMSDEPFRHVVISVPNPGYEEAIAGPMLATAE